MKLSYSVLGVSLFPESEERCSFGVLHAEKNIAEYRCQTLLYLLPNKIINGSFLFFY